MATTVFVNVHEAETHLARLLEQMAAGERVIICEAGTPVAELVPHRSQPVVIGGLKGEVRYGRCRLGKTRTPRSPTCSTVPMLLVLQG